MQMAILSVRTERAAEQESGRGSPGIVRHRRRTTSTRKRIDLANELFESLGENPRNNLRNLPQVA